MAVTVAVPPGDPQRRQDQDGPLVGGGVPGEDALGEGVDDERDVDETGPGATVGECTTRTSESLKGSRIIHAASAPLELIGR